MPDPDLNFVLRRLDAIQKELREGLHTMALRDEQREASHQVMFQTLTRQMVHVTTAVEERLNGVDARLDAIDARLDAIEAGFTRLETTLADIARKLGV
jgi:hypothetical protein